MYAPIQSLEMALLITARQTIWLRCCPILYVHTKLEGRPEVDEIYCLYCDVRAFQYLLPRLHPVLTQSKDHLRP